MDETSLVRLRDRALVAVMAFTFARLSAVVDLKVEDYYPTAVAMNAPLPNTPLPS